ncbi:death-associated protein 1 isoform X3 [Odocoileus virginianus]|uniref:Death-associated protein 1 isoform X3 n=1 Tax=Odocoileus virginianus TaxID=9874 RepID=A0ABM4IXR4_ODOVR
MSSPPEGKLETKAGHPPAVKAGGMRIVQKHPHSGDTKEEKDKDDQEWESPRQPSVSCVNSFSPHQDLLQQLLTSAEYCRRDRPGAGGDWPWV